MKVRSKSVSNPNPFNIDLTLPIISEFENMSDGYASGKDTDVASIDLLDRNRPWMLKRKNRSRNRNRRINRMTKSKVVNIN